MKPTDDKAFDLLAPMERLERGLAAGRQQLELYARHHGIGLEEAREILERNKQVGRTPCSFLDQP